MKYIEELREGERIGEVYLCKHKQTATTKAGKPYDSLILQDKTGTLDAKIWDVGSSGIEEFDKLDYIYVVGDVTSFQGALQLNVKRVKKMSETDVNPSDYLPVSEYNIEEMYQKLLAYIAQMKHREQIDAAENEELRSFPTDKMCDVGDTQIYNGISYRIDAVEVRDNLRNLDQHGYQDEVSEKLKKGIGVDEKLNLQSYERETITFGNGYDQPLTYVEKTEHVTPKLVLVTMTIQNISYEDEEDMLPVANPLTYIKKTADHTEFDWREFERGERNLYYRENMPIWISDSEGGSWYYCKKMKKGDCATIQFGYLVDEDLLDEMVMELNFGDGLQDGAWNFIELF